MDSSLRRIVGCIESRWNTRESLKREIQTAIDKDRAA
jgi:hypothetical protein